MESYHLLLKFGDTIVPLQSCNLRELTIVQDFNSFLPEIRLRMDDNSGLLTHILPFDRNMNQVYVELSLDQLNVTDRNAWTFDIYRTKPEGVQGLPTSNYDIVGLLQIDRLFSPDYSRGFTGTVKSTLETISRSLGTINSNEISLSLNYILNLVQPTWTNAQFLNFLKAYLIGSSGEYGFKSFVKTQNFKNIFTFMGLSEMIQSPIAYKFILNSEGYQDRLPIFNYAIYNNYKVYGVMGVKQQNYAYFDYFNSTYVQNSKAISEYGSLSDYHLVDQADLTDNIQINSLGRSTEFTVDFKGYVKGKQGNRILNLVNMWITTQGIPNAVPGQIIEIFFPQGLDIGNLYSYQYGGYWLIEKVVHTCGDVFLTKLLLTRNGVDTDKSTTLLQATSKKRF